MQDIPRNELLDKLAAGWKVRRKSWEKHHPYFITLKWNETITPSALIADDWEGEPPEPRRMYEGCAITFAFEKLQKNAAFIRRSAWTKASICKNTVSLMCSIEDILATDWEVWG